MKKQKVDDEVLDIAARSLGVQLTDMLRNIDAAGRSGVGQPVMPVLDVAARCSFCGGAGEVEVEVEDFAGSWVVITILCPHGRRPRPLGGHTT